MANDGVDYAEIRRRVAALRKPELCECLERLNMRKGGNKPDLQRRLLDIFEDSYNLALNGHPPPRDMFKITSAQRVIEDVYNRWMNSSGAAANGATATSAAPLAAPAADTKPGPASTSAPHAPTNGTSRTAQPGAAAGGNLFAGTLDAFLRNQGPVAARGGSSGASGSRPAPAAPVPSMHIRCCCGSQSERQPLWQCRASGCGVYQHGQCVGLNPGVRPAVGEFYCELCRAKRADPFWEVEDSSITGSIRLSSSNKHAQVPGALPQLVRSAERTFMLSDHLSKKVRNRQSNYQLQLACLQLNDSVPFRFHWPLGTALDVNGVQYRVYSRNGHHKLGANGRDEPANIGLLCPTGHNRLTISGTDNSPYVLLVLLVRRRTTDEVRRLMMPQLSVRDALQRVRHQLRGDDDDEVQTGATMVSLRCPILGARVRIPGRFSEVPGLATFDLEAFLDSAARTRKWQCPLSMTHSHVHNLQVDTYTQRIIRALAAHPEVMEVEVAADGSWRPAGWQTGFFSIELEEPLRGRGPGDGGGTTGDGGGGGGDDDDDDEEEDEAEELRKAAAAVAANLKRKRAPSPDVIDLASSDNDDEGQQPQQPAAAAKGTNTTQQQTVAPVQPLQTGAPVNGGARHGAVSTTTTTAAAAAPGHRHGDGSSAAPPGNTSTSAPQHPPLRIALQGRVLTTQTSGGHTTTQAPQAQTTAGAGAAGTGGPFPLSSFRRQMGHLENMFAGQPFPATALHPQAQQQQQQQQQRQPHAQPATQTHSSTQRPQPQPQAPGSGTSRPSANTGTGGTGREAQPGTAGTGSTAGPSSSATGNGGGGGVAGSAGGGGTGGGGGVSIRQPVTAQSRNPIRIHMAANQTAPPPPQAGDAAGTVAQPHEPSTMATQTPGLPVINPYHPSTNTSAISAGGGTGTAACAAVSIPRWLTCPNSVLGGPTAHPQPQQQAQPTPQHGQQPQWLGLTALGGAGQAVHEQPQPQSYATISTHPPSAQYFAGQQQQQAQPQQQLMPQRSVGAPAWQHPHQHPLAQGQTQQQTYQHPSQQQKPQQQAQAQAHQQAHQHQHAAGVAAAVAFFQQHAVAAAHQAAQSHLAQRQMAGPGGGPPGAAGSGSGPPSQPAGVPAALPPPVYDLIEITDSGDED